MAQKFLVPIDHSKLESLNFRLQNLSAAPGSPAVGQTYFDTDDSLIHFWDGAAWVSLSTGGTSLTQEQVEDIIGAMVTGNTETRIAVTYDDGAGKLDFVVDALNTEEVQDVVGAMMVAGNLIDVTYDDVANTLSVAVEALAISDITGLQGALDAKQAMTERGEANGYASLDGGGKVPSAQLPALALTDVHVVADITARDALTVQEGDVAIVTGTSETYIYDGTAWQEIVSPVDGVTAVTGAGVITSTGGATPEIALGIGTGLENSGGSLRIAAATAGDGLAGGGGSALAVGAGNGISVAADAVAVDTGVVVRKYVGAITGDATSEVITHNLGTRDVDVALRNNASPWEEVIVDNEATTVNTVTIRSAENLPAGYRISIHG